MPLSVIVGDILRPGYAGNTVKSETRHNHLNQPDAYHPQTIMAPRLVPLNNTLRVYILLQINTIRVSFLLLGLLL